VEALTGLLFFLAYRSWADHLPTAGMVSAALAALVAISFIDFDLRRIPDAITKPGMVLAVLLAPAYRLHPQDWLSRIGPGLNAFLHAGAGLLTGWLVILGVRLLGRLAFKKEAMGLGDAKLLALLGALSGPEGVFYALLTASLTGAVSGLLLLAISRFRPVPCTGEVVVDGASLPLTGVRFRKGDLRVPAPRDAAAGAPVRVRVVLPAKRILEDQDATIVLSGRLSGRDEGEAPGARAWWSLEKDAVDALGTEDRERLDLFSQSSRYVSFGPFLSIGGAAYLLWPDGLRWLLTVAYAGAFQRAVP
jgi:prepilin signal peptidase PulO-like enzyme (type II secretory pathway)